MKYKSVKTKILVWFSFTTLTLLVIFNVSFYYLFKKNLESGIESKLYKNAIFIEDLLEENKNPIKIVSNKLLIDLQIQILRNNRPLIQVPNFDFYKYIKTQSKFILYYHKETIEAALIHKFDEPFKGTIVIVKKDINNTLEDIIEIMFILNPILLLTLSIFANRLIDKILNPIIDITKTAQNININRLSKTIPTISEENEIKELIDAFNNMIYRLKDGFEQIERFNTDISHELKTPLTIIKGEVNYALKKVRSINEYQNSLGIIKYETTQLQKMIDNMLLLVQYNQENISKTFKRIDMDIILLEILDRYNNIINNKNLKINIEKFEPVIHNANPQLISIIFSNIIDNAIKYTPQNKTITISLFKKDKIIFCVQDEGIGIDEIDLPKITDRFYKVDISRTKNDNYHNKSFGLGLYIVKNSLKLHNATLEITSKKDIGTTVKIIF